MSKDNNDLLFNQCRIYDLIENYNDMFNSLKNINTDNYKLQTEDLELYTRCFKCYIGRKRSQYRKIKALISTDDLVDNKKHSKLLEILRKGLSEEITNLCKEVIKICENILSHEQELAKISLFFNKTLADHYRYIYEIDEDDKDSKNKAKENYEKALKIAKEGKFLPTDIYYLTFCLNYSVFLHDVMGDKEEAISFSKNCLNAALKETEEVVDNNQKDIILICQMIKDNLSLWKNEMPEELNIL